MKRLLGVREDSEDYPTEDRHPKPGFESLCVGGGHSVAGEKDRNAPRRRYSFGSSNQEKSMKTGVPRLRTHLKLRRRPTKAVEFGNNDSGLFV